MEKHETVSYQLGWCLGTSEEKFILVYSGKFTLEICQAIPILSLEWDDPSLEK